MTDYVALVEDVMRGVLDQTEAATAHLFSSRDLPLYGVLRYHLGWAESDFTPGSLTPGKRLRPLICVLSCLAAGGQAEHAIPTAASIELLHNFTLVHDDVQDRSATRHHRPTVWALWGDGQAINAGDALFALSQLPLLESIDGGVPARRIALIAQRLNETVLRIVEGQVLDLGFEERWGIGADDYLRMIGGKTATLVSFASWAGAILAGADDERVTGFSAFGRALGLGFQVRDDLLGIWGAADVTGKPAADDIRRRKKSLPIVMLASEAVPDDLEQVQSIYAQDDLSEDDVSQVLRLLARYEVRERVQEAVDRYHDEARTLLERSAPASPARDELEALAERLATRAF